MSQVVFSGDRGSHPTVHYEIWAGASRSGQNVNITFEIYTDVGKSDASFLQRGGAITFYGGNYDGSTQASSVIKAYDEELRGTGHYNICSFTITNSSSNMNVYFRIDAGTGFSSDYGIYTLSATIPVPSYNPPYWENAWISANPNPCNINSAPVITWGGAKAGSSGIIKYDVDVASSKPGGGWTSWLNIASGQNNAYYNEIALKNMNVYNVIPFVGVSYQYRVRIWDGTGNSSDISHSNYIIVQISVTFTVPSAPNIYWTSNTTKKNATASVNWTTPNGGSGSIIGYNLVVQLMNQNQQTVISTFNYNNITGNSLSLIPIGVFPSAANGEYLKAYIYSKNSWGQTSNVSNNSFILIKGNQIWIKIDGTWHEGECYIKINGSWREGLPYIKTNGTWHEST